jgi:hypothetical protein
MDSGPGAYAPSRNDVIMKQTSETKHQVSPMSTLK